MPRSIWKGAITFGLVHIPVALYPASQSDDIDFDWLDSRSMDPVGYKRINKRTGKEVKMEQIVRGVQHGDGYVLVDDDEIRNAYPRTTQTIEIEGFVEAGDVPFVHLEKPYVLAPVNRGEKVYALLREALLDSKRIGIARFVVHTKEHLAALIPAGPALMLDTLRWASEIRALDELDLPAAGRKGAGLKDSELKMARQLVDDMSTRWDASKYSNRFNDAIRTLVEKKAKAGKTKTIEPLEEPLPDEASNVIDLTALLKQSLAKGGGRRPAARAGADGGKAPAKRTSAKGAGSAGKAARKTASSAKTQKSAKATKATKGTPARKRA